MRILLLPGSLLALLASAADAQKLSVYVLAGQSNMEGHAKIETFDYIGDDEATAPWLDDMRGADGEPRVCENTWISYLTGGPRGDGEGFGRLTAGYGARRDPAVDGGKIGPEFTFGLQVAKADRRPGIAHQDRVGWQVAAHGLPSAVRRPLRDARRRPSSRLKRQGRRTSGKLEADKVARRPASTTAR